MYKFFIILLMGFFSCNTLFSQDKKIEKIWRLTNTNGNIYTHSIVDELVSDEDVFKFDSDGNVIAIPEIFVNDENENSTTESIQPQIIGKWTWADKTTIEFQYYQRGWVIKKKLKVSKLTDKELILILLPE